MKIKLAALILTCLVILFSAHIIFKALPKPSFVDRGEGVVCNPVPQFMDYPTAVGSRAITLPINFTSNSRAEALKPEILAATASGLNFAKNYLLVEGACGLNCQNHAI